MNLMTDSKMGKWLRLALLGLLGTLMVVALANGAAQYFSLTRLAENRETLAQFVSAYFIYAVFLFMLVYALATALSLPGGAVLTMAGGFLFGVWLGSLLVVIAATTGAVLLFLIAKTTLGEMLAKKAGNKIQELQQGFRQNAFYYLLFLRLVPLFPFWLVNFAPALLGVSLWVYIRATFIGIIPGVFAFAFLGRGLDSIILQHQKNYTLCLAQQPKKPCDSTLAIGDLFTIEMVIALTLLGCVALIPIFFKKSMRA